MHVTVDYHGRSVFLRIAPFLMLMGIKYVSQYDEGGDRDILLSSASYRGELSGDMKRDVEISLPINVPEACYSYDYDMADMYRDGNYDVAVIYQDKWGTKRPVLLWWKDKNVILATDIFYNRRCTTFTAAAIAALLDAVLDIMPPKIRYFEIGDKIVGLDGNIYDSVEKYEEKLIREIKKSLNRVMAAIRRANKSWETS